MPAHRINMRMYQRRLYDLYKFDGGFSHDRHVAGHFQGHGHEVPRTGGCHRPGLGKRL
ncbi:protein of unknown function (plasmid) [Caballeronia sp. S22]